MLPQTEGGKLEMEGGAVFYCRLGTARRYDGLGSGVICGAGLRHVCRKPGGAARPLRIHPGPPVAHVSCC